MTTESSAPQAFQISDENPRHLAPKGDITIFEVSEFKDALTKLFQNDGLVSLDLSGVTRVDTAAIQLLLAAKKQNRMFVPGISEDLQTRLQQLGFIESLSE
ncbi:MAG: STAS domain-containing protein [Nitrospira sp.]|nr:STAS domain-containing protein [Nitrospira sp.]